MSEERIIAPLPRGWLSIDDAAAQVTKAVGQGIAKVTLGRMARQAGIEVHRMNVVTESMSCRGPRRRKTLVMCVREIDLPQLLEYVADRVAHCDTLLDVEGKSRSPDPTPDEIRQRAAECREKWADYDWVNRGSGRVKEVETPQLHVQFKRGKVYSIG